MGTYTTFYIVRHGQTDWNSKKILQGHKDIPLNETGKLEAKKLSKVLENIKFDHVFSSDLQRAKQTAEIVKLEKKIAIQTTRLLRERSYGELEGKPLEVLMDLRKKLEQLSEQEQFRYKYAEGFESNEEIVARFITFLRETAVAYLDKTILVVSHGGMMRVLLQHVGFVQDRQKLEVQNAAYIQLQSDGIDFFIRETKGIHVENA